MIIYTNWIKINTEKKNQVKQYFDFLGNIFIFNNPFYVTIVIALQWHYNKMKLCRSSLSKKLKEKVKLSAFEILCNNAIISMIFHIFCCAFPESLHCMSNTFLNTTINKWCVVYELKGWCYGHAVKICKQWCIEISYDEETKHS